MRMSAGDVADDYIAYGLDAERVMKPGTQIVYVPNHKMDRFKKLGEMNFGRGSCEPGFVASESQVDGSVFCRYWRITHTQEVIEHDLRTKANSELTPISNLIARETVPQEVVDDLMAELGYDEDDESDWEDDFGPMR